MSLPKPIILDPADTTFADRFWRRVKVGSPEACWEWTGARHRRGYGNTMAGGKMASTHRIAWVLTFGPIPEGLHVLHKCDNPPCCNPYHLFVGTHCENMRDMAAKGRGKSSQGEHCHLHKITDEDVKQIRTLRAAGLTHQQIADQFGLSRSNVKKINLRHIWTHI